jgi:hypothetical protein
MIFRARTVGGGGRRARAVGGGGRRAAAARTAHHEAETLRYGYDDDVANPGVRPSRIRHGKSLSSAATGVASRAKEART